MGDQIVQGLLSPSLGFEFYPEVGMEPFEGFEEQRDTINVTSP